MYPDGDVFVPKIELVTNDPLGPHIRVWAKFADGRKLLGMKVQIRLAIGKQTLESDDMKIRLHSPVAASQSELANLPEWVNQEATEWAMITTQNELPDWHTLAKAVELYYFGEPGDDLHFTCRDGVSELYRLDYDIWRRKPEVSQLYTGQSAQ